MYYFYINFPRFSDKTILIHSGACSKCNNGLGLRGLGSTSRGFWAGPFMQHAQASAALDLLVSKFVNPPLTSNCDCI